MKKLTSFELFLLFVTVGFVCFVASSLMPANIAACTIALLMGLFIVSLIQISNNADKNI